MSAPKFTSGPWVQYVDSGRCEAIMPAGRSGDICTFTKVPSAADADLMTAAPDLFHALETFVKEYVSLVESGDAGFWNPEEEAKVIAARAALSKANPTTRRAAQ